MAIISQIGRKHWKVRLLFLGMYAFLIIGGATMVYPFMLMLSGSTKSSMDIQFFDAFPRFLRDDPWMFSKHLEGLFNERLQDLNVTYDLDEIAFNRLNLYGDLNAKLADAWSEFLGETELPWYSFSGGYLNTQLSKTIPSGLRNFKKMLKRQYGSELEKVNRELETEFAGWYSIFINVPSYLMRREKPMDTRFNNVLNEFQATLPYGMRYYFSPQGFYKKQFLKTQYSQDIELYNSSHGTSYGSWDEVVLPRRYPENGTDKEKEDWTNFVRGTVALHWLRVDEAAAPYFHELLKARHQDNIRNLNRLYETNYSSFEEVPLWKEPPMSGMAVTDWDSFITGYKDPVSGKFYEVPIKMIRFESTETKFQDWVVNKHGSVEQAAASLGASWTKLEDIKMPQLELHLSYFKDNMRGLRWEFVTRNYRAVADYMMFHGRGIYNTVVYCSLAVLTALLINPLAAYAMSRYKMPSTYKILLFLMSTMAFPAMVTAIPSFIMLRKFNMLNTFAALILPGMANGYSIFLLKGFFDSLPQELYESAQLDGANEWVLFWEITMGLSKPILAVIALSAFTAAYSNFMFAFVVCQDRKMWTMMVWLYELQQSSGQAVMYASLVIAAIPTFLIFLFCQNIIMRGIVVPSEK
ncbi:MAG: carbohydrate ABC transporter permease [Lentisphaerae bacterium]|jgi:ABC-type glycerol-3-phosphate transport system permease component|nr:carbohydrate ABC transporter permease [Lentisphaerota bacterium]